MNASIPTVPLSLFQRGLLALRALRSGYAEAAVPVRIFGRFRIEPGAMMVLEAAPGAVIRSHAGELWVTQEGNREDRVLSAGQSFSPRGHGKVVVQSFAGAVVELAPSAPAQSVHTPNEPRP